MTSEASAAVGEIPEAHTGDMLVDEAMDEEVKEEPAETVDTTTLEEVAASTAAASPLAPGASPTEVLKTIVASSKVQSFVLPATPASPHNSLRAAQESLVAAGSAAHNALHTASVMNRVEKTSRGKGLNGAFSDSAQDALRSSLLFAGAGLDQSLKRLVQGTLPILVAQPGVASDKFQQWAAQSIAHPESGGVDPQSLVDLLVGAGEHPRDILVQRYVTRLTHTSAQSVERVDEIASALGVTDKNLRQQIAPGGSLSQTLKDAFVARNQISHELDLLKLGDRSSQGIQRRRRSRTFKKMWGHANACLSITQLIVNDVANRVGKG